MMIIIPNIHIVLIIITTDHIIIIRSIRQDFIGGVPISYGILFSIMDYMTIIMDITALTIGAPLTIGATLPIGATGMAEL